MTQPTTIRKNFVVTEPIDRILTEAAKLRGIPASEIVRWALVNFYRDELGIESDELRASIRLTGGAPLKGE